MNLILRSVPVTAAWLLLSLAFLCFSQDGSKLTHIRRVTAESKRDKGLEAAIVQSLDEQPSPENPLSYSYNRVDLNGDGRPEVLVYVSGSHVCGSGGCLLLILTAQQNGYKLVSEIALARPPVIVSDKSSNGWNDLILFVPGAAGAAGHYATVAFEDGHYPENPTTPPAKPSGSSVQGVAYLTGADRPQSGIPIAK